MTNGRAANYEMRRQRAEELRERGAVLQCRENRHGETLSGWWIDDVWLGKTMEEALAAIKGQ